MLARALRLGTALFLLLMGVCAIALAAVFWHHQTIATQASHSSDPEVHTVLIFALGVSPLSLAASAVVAWLLCIAIGYLWVAWRH
jgi:hypothetical protein